MRKYLKEIVILLIQLMLLYVFPLFAGPTDVIGMVVLMLAATFVLSILIAIISNTVIKYYYPGIVAIVFMPSIFIYYNSSAFIHSTWYLIVSSIGVFVGIIICKLTHRNR